jgi:hypothetical protein
VKIKDKLEAAQKELAKLVAGPIFGEGTDPTEIEIVLWAHRYGGVRIAEISHVAGNSGLSFLRDDIMYGSHDSYARLFLMCETWLVYTAYGDETEDLPDLTKAIQAWKAPEDND